MEEVESKGDVGENEEEVKERDEVATMVEEVEEEVEEKNEEEVEEEKGEVEGQVLLQQETDASEPPHQRLSVKTEEGGGGRGEMEQKEEEYKDSSSSDDETLVSSACSISTTTSYLHGDKTTVQRLVSRGLRKKQQQIQRRGRSRIETRKPAHHGAKKKGGKHNELKISNYEW